MEVAHANRNCPIHCNDAAAPIVLKGGFYLRKIVTILTLIFLLTMITACKKSDTSDFYSSKKMEEHIEKQDYESLNEMLSQRAKDRLSREDFEHFQKVLKEKEKFNPSRKYSKYEMISFDNEITFLLNIGREGKISGIKVVPKEESEEIGDLFNIK